MKRMFRILMVILALAMPVYVVAQSNGPTAAQKKVEKKKAERKKQAVKSDKKAKDHQMKIQDKKTQKRMKKHKKQTAHPYGKKPNFFQRMFGKKH